MASVHRKGDAWVVRWRNHGDPKNHSAPAPSNDIAKRIKLAAETARALGKPYHGPKAEAEAVVARRVDLRELAKAYIQSRRRKGQADGTIYQTNIAITMFLNTLSVDDEAPIDGELLTTDALNAYYDHLREQRGCSLAYSRGRVECVQRWWEWLGKTDPWADRVGRPRTIEMARPPAMAEPVAPTWAEMDLAIACAHGHHALTMTVARYTGLRGEDQVLQLRADDIRRDTAELRIRPELGKTWAEKTGRTVPLSRHLLAMMDTWPEDPDGWLVHVPKTGRHPGPAHRRAWNDQTSGAWRRAGVRPEVWDTQPTTDGKRKNGRPMHAFRKGVITNLQALGVPLPDVQYLVGHKLSGGVTVERYTDPTVVRKLREAVDLIPGPSLVEVRRIQGGAVVAVPFEGRYRRD